MNTRSTFWAPISPDGEIDVDRFTVVKGECKLTAAEKKAGWRVDEIIVCTAASYNAGKIY